MRLGVFSALSILDNTMDKKRSPIVLNILKMHSDLYEELSGAAAVICFLVQAWNEDCLFLHQLIAAPLEAQVIL